jgi:radical SAM superfamily enzyme YgiQ (UPF0313 family)
MRVAFVAPPQFQHGFTLSEDCCWGLCGSRYLPAGLLACASQMEDAFFFDLSIESARNLKLRNPDVIVYPLIPQPAGTSFHSIMSEICKDIPKIVLAVPPGYMEDYARMEPNPFCVVYSEPEAVFADLHDDLGEWRAGSRGTAWVDGGSYKTGPRTICIHDIKGTNWDLVPPSYWFYYECIIYQISRGCPWRCNFCVWGGSTVTDRTFRMRPAEQVITDLANLEGTINKYLKLLHSIPLQLLSAQLTTDIKWVRKFHSLGGSPLPFHGNITLNELTEEKTELLSQSGMQGFLAGLEALTDPLLKRLNKPHDFEDIIRSIHILNRADVNYSLNLISGGYGESKEEISESLNNIDIIHEEIDHSNIAIGSPVMYYKGTDITANPPGELAYDPYHHVRRQKHIHVAKWLEVGRRLRECNLLDKAEIHYPVERLIG